VDRSFFSSAEREGGRGRKRNDEGGMGVGEGGKERK
jgi:hypothetical protein